MSAPLASLPARSSSLHGRRSPPPAYSPPPSAPPEASVFSPVSPPPLTAPALLGPNTTSPFFSEAAAGTSVPPQGGPTDAPAPGPARTRTRTRRAKPPKASLADELLPIPTTDTLAPALRRAAAVGVVLGFLLVTVFCLVTDVPAMETGVRAALGHEYTIRADR